MTLEIYKCFWFGVCYAFPVVILLGVYLGIKRAFSASAPRDDLNE